MLCYLWHYLQLSPSIPHSLLSSTPTTALLRWEQHASNVLSGITSLMVHVLWAKETARPMTQGQECVQAAMLDINWETIHLAVGAKGHIYCKGATLVPIKCASPAPGVTILTTMVTVKLLMTCAKSSATNTRDASLVIRATYINPTTVGVFMRIVEMIPTVFVGKITCVWAVTTDFISKMGNALSPTRTASPYPMRVSAYHAIVGIFCKAINALLILPPTTIIFAHSTIQTINACLATIGLS